MAAATIEMTQKLKFKLLLHLAHYPDLILSDNNIFGLLRDVLHTNNEDVNDMVHVWLHTEPRTFFIGGIRKLID
jgi:hypothetical protein